MARNKETDTIASSLLLVINIQGERKWDTQFEI